MSGCLLSRYGLSSVGLRAVSYIRCEARAPMRHFRKLTLPAMPHFKESLNEPLKQRVSFNFEFPFENSRDVRVRKALAARISFASCTSRAFAFSLRRRDRENEIFIAAIVFCHKTYVKMLYIPAVIYIAKIVRFRSLFEKNR